MCNTPCHTLARMNTSTASLEDLGRQIAANRDQKATIWETARQAAIAAYDNGTPETHLAVALGVDRNTIRRWLGKL